MQNLTTQQMQVLRTMDKHDAIGTAGVVALLQKPESEFGAGLSATQARMVGDFLETKGADNAETLGNIRAWFVNAQAKRAMADIVLKSPLVMSRCKMLCVLDDDVIMEDGETGLDTLLNMPANADQTWRGAGRPENLAWALDDILRMAADAGVGEAGMPDFARGVLVAAQSDGQ